MKKIYKESLISIKKTKKRFISILLIVLLGVGFFAGIKAASPDMRNTLQSFYEKYNFMDFNIKSTWGITKEDKEKIEKEGYVVELGYSLDSIVKQDVEAVAHILSYNENDNINKLIVVDGRLPKNKDECVVEYSGYHEYAKIGDVIELDNDNVKEKNLKVVGLVKSPLYISVEKGSTNLLNGSINYYMYMLEDNFKLDYYTDMYVDLKTDLYTFGNDYDDLIAQKEKELFLITDDLASSRYEDSKKELSEKLEVLKEEYNRNKKEYNTISRNPYISTKVKANFLNSLDDMNDKIEELEKSLKDLKKPEWYILNRDSNVGFYQYEQDSDRIANIAKLFPLVFFVVAVLICLTTMTRMVEEERVQLGTLKSLGYTNGQIISKYLNYAMYATLIGSVIGVCIGFVVLPKVIFNMYKMMYNIDSLNISFNFYYAFLGTGIALACTVLATLFTCYKELLEVPAQLMRPKSPKAGKKVFLEHIPFIWNRLNFSNKVTVRNVFRYKKRFLMTIIGIAGCTSLILAGFGLKDCIVNMVPNQYEEIFSYQVTLTLDDGLSADELQKITTELSKDSRIKGYIRLHEEAIELPDFNTNQTIRLIVPFDELDGYINLRNRKSKEKESITDGIVITEKISKLLNIAKGDEIKINGKKSYIGKVKGIAENYIYHYIYMDKSLYDSDLFNTIYIKTAEMNEQQESELGKSLKNIKGVSSISFLSSTKNIFDDTMDNFGLVAMVLIVSAGLLAFVVLYNLSTVNISERKRELATIKVLGFYNHEVYNYINKETTILTIIGIALGLGFGIILTNFIIKTCELDMMMFATNIDKMSYIFAILITLVFTLIVNVMVYFALKKIDMIESLKSIE